MDEQSLLSDATCCEGADAVDWGQVLALPRFASLLPFLYYQLRECAGLPQTALAGLKRAYYRNLLRNQRLYQDLLEVAESFDREGIEVLVLKGGSLAWTVYPHPAMRPMCDLDLLLRPVQMDRAEEVLGRLGFVLSESMPRHLLSFQKRFGGGVTWVRQREGRTTLLDLQHHLIGVDWVRRGMMVDMAAVWKAARPLLLGDVAAWQLSVEDMLIHLSLHLAVQHGYHWSPINLVDMGYVLAEAGEGFSWERVVERAAAFRARTVLYVGLSLAGRLAGVSVPPEILGWLASGLDRWAWRFFLPSLSSAEGRRISGVEHLILHIALLDGAVDRLRMLRGILFPEREWLRIRYPDGADPLWVVRAAHLLRLGRALWRGLRRPLVESGLGEARGGKQDAGCRREG